MRTSIRFLAALALLAGLALVPTAAFAQSAKTGKSGTEFIEFDPTKIGGGPRGHGSLILGKEQRPVFEKLLQLKKSFKPLIAASARDHALR